MEVKTRTYQIEKKTFYFRNSARGFMEFEEMTGKPVSDCDESVTDVIKLVYACTKAGMNHEGKPFILDFEAFLDLIDGHLDVIMELGKAEGDPEKK